jgi:FtsH-binding integral membrane protein
MKYSSDTPRWNSWLMYSRNTKASFVGALALYLDFINLSLFLLRIFGSAR